MTLTTTIGAFPKPDAVTLPDWFSARNPAEAQAVTHQWARARRELTDTEFESIVTLGTKAVLDDQIAAGIDIPTDGEVPRENYLHYHCRHLGGIDFDKLESKALRAGQFETALPVWTGPVTTGEHFLDRDFKRAQALTDRPVKITVPGPFTLAASTANRYYDNNRDLVAALANAVNFEVRALANAGCRHIQIDEPVFARESQAALDYGIENLERAFHGVPDTVQRTLHICCGYPYGLDQEDYPKAPRSAYFELASDLDASSIDAVSIEDAHRHNDLALLENFTNTKVILGVVAIARSRVESVEEISERIEQAHEHIDADRLMAAPDCGLGFLGRDLAVRKLSALGRAARKI